MGCATQYLALELGERGIRVNQAVLGLARRPRRAVLPDDDGRAAGHHRAGGVRRDRRHATRSAASRRTRRVRARSCTCCPAWPPRSRARCWTSTAGSTCRHDHVVTSVTVEIAAPAAFVWDVLVDYPHYPQWNPYTVAVATTLEIGRRSTSRCRIPTALAARSSTASSSGSSTRRTTCVTTPREPRDLRVRDQWITELGPGPLRVLHDRHDQRQVRGQGHGADRRLGQGRLRLGGACAEGPGGGAGCALAQGSDSRFCLRFRQITSCDRTGVRLEWGYEFGGCG